VPCTIRYDTRCYFNVRSKADISQLNLSHGDEQTEFERDALMNAQPMQVVANQWRHVVILAATKEVIYSMLEGA